MGTAPTNKDVKLKDLTNVDYTAGSYEDDGQINYRIKKRHIGEANAPKRKSDQSRVDSRASRRKEHRPYLTLSSNK
jgi:hypothetical protein